MKAGPVGGYRVIAPNSRRSHNGRSTMEMLSDFGSHSVNKNWCRSLASFPTSPTVWRILRAFGLPYSASTHYDCGPEIFDDCRVALHLDPIDPALVGGVSLKFQTEPLSLLRSTGTSLVRPRSFRLHHRIRLNSFYGLPRMFVLTSVATSRGRAHQTPPAGSGPLATGIWSAC
jgi:hypothetical protein